MRDRELVFLEALLSVNAHLKEIPLINSIRALDKTSVANTAKKREAIAHCFTLSMEQFVDRRKDVYSAMDAIVKKDISTKDKIGRLINFVHTQMDAGVAIGFILGNYMVNNETLDDMLPVLETMNKGRRSSPEVQEMIGLVKGRLHAHVEEHAQRLKMPHEEKVALEKDMIGESDFYV